MEFAASSPTRAKRDDMTTKDKVARRKLSLLELASEMENVFRACRIMGYSRQQFYEIRRNYQTHGADGLIDRLPGARGPHNGTSSRIRHHFLNGAHPCRADGLRPRTGFRWVRPLQAPSGSTCCGASSIAADMTAPAAAGSVPQGSARPSRQRSRPVPRPGPAPFPPGSPPPSRARS